MATADQSITPETAAPDAVETAPHDLRTQRPTGHAVKSYVIDQLIARDDLGLVYRAWDPLRQGTVRLVELQPIDADGKPQATLMRRFVATANALARQPLGTVAGGFRHNGVAYAVARDDSADISATAILIDHGLAGDPAQEWRATLYGVYLMAITAALFGAILGPL